MLLHCDQWTDTQAIEVTIQRLIGSGMDPKTENNPYLGFIYTSFQERATKVRLRSGNQGLKCHAGTPGPPLVCQGLRVDCHVAVFVLLGRTGSC